MDKANADQDMSLNRRFQTKPVLFELPLRAGRTITFGVPQLASEISNRKGFHSGRRGG